MKKNLLRIILVFALIIGGVFSSFALTWYSINTGAEGGNTGFPPPHGYVAGSDGFTSVEVGAAAQYIFAGADRQIDPPAQDGGVSGDDVLITLNGVGTDGAWGTFGTPPIPGVFYYGVSGTTEVLAPIHVYVRAWNTWEVGASGSYYGDSNIVTAAASTVTPPLPTDVTLTSYYTNNSFDFTPPLPPDPFTATPEADGDIFLNWTNTNEADFTGTMIRFLTGSTFPTNETEGALVTNMTGGTNESRSVTHESLVWNTTYKYSAFSYDSSDNYSSPATAEATSTDTLPPSVEVFVPDGGELYAGGSLNNITWEATENGNSGFGSDPIAIRYSSNEGNTWIFITQEANDGSYAWTVPFITTDEARISIEAVDNAGNIGTDISDTNFTIDSASPEVGSISLYDRTTSSTVRTNDQTITVEAFGVSADATQMMIAQNAGFSLNSTGWISYTATTEYSLTAGDGTKEVYYKVRDAVSLESTPVNNSIILDTTGPTGTSITINGGAAYTKEANVNLTLTATDEWAPMMMNISNEATFLSENWESFSSNKAWILTAGDGTKTVYAKFRDNGSNESGTESDTIIVDTAPPTVEVTRPDGGEVFIGGAAENITWTATDAASGFGATPITIWYTSNEGTSWIYITTEANSGTYSWTVPTINSTQCRVSVEAIDLALNADRDMSAATFTIDSTAPTVTSITVWDRTSGSTVRTNDPTVSVEAFGISADAAEMLVSYEASFAGASWQSLSATFEYTVSSGDGNKTVYYKVRDAALQESSTVEASIILDTTGPTGTSITIDGGAPFTKEADVTLTLTATDEWAPMMMNISNEATFLDADWETFSTSKAWGLTAGDGTKTVYAKFRDGGSNESGSVNDDILLDTLAPTVEVTAPDGGEVWIGGSAHDITWTATDEGSGFGTTPIVIWFTSNGGTSWEYITTEANNGSYSWTLPTIDSTQCRVSVEATDLAQNVGRDASDANFTIDSSVPTVTSIEVRDRTTGDTDRTNERPVSVEAFGVSGDANEMMVSSEASFAGASWQSFVATFEYTLPSGDGAKTVYYKVRDASLQESGSVNDSIILDTTGPSGTSISINGGAYATNEVSVTLTLAATDEWTPLEMNVSNEASYPAANWESFNASRSWTLTAGDATKTVYVRYRDGGGNTTDASDTIIYDATPPTVTVVRPDGGETFVGNTNENIQWTAVDPGGSGFIGTSITIRYSSNEGAAWIYIDQVANSSPYSWFVPYITSSECLVSIEAVDRAGNWGYDVSDGTFEVDSSAPIVSSIEAKDRTTGDTERTNERIVSVEAFGESGGVWMRLAQNSGFTTNDTDWIAYQDPYEYTMTIGDGSKTIYYKLLDASSRESSTVEASIILDTTGPTSTSLQINGGMTATNDATVLLTLTATDEWPPLEMKISNEATLAGGVWEPFAETKLWYLGPPDGTRTVYAGFRDGGQNESTTVESDSIDLDTASPEVTNYLPIGTNVPLTASIEVWFSKAMDKASAQIAFHMTPEVTGTFSWVGDTLMIFQPDAPLFKGVTYEVFVTNLAKDTIGNSLADAPHIWFFTPVPDNIPPIVKNYLIDGKTFPASENIRIISNSPAITANIQDEGEASGINAIKVFVDNTAVYSGTYQDWDRATFTIGGPSDGDFSVSLSALDEGTYDVTIWASDYAGNISEEAYADLEVHETTNIIGRVLNHPNPFSPLKGEKTAIAYTLTKDAGIAIFIYDIKGSLIWKTTCPAGAAYPNTVVGMGGKAGYNEVIWDGYSAFRRVMGNGIYIMRVAVIGENKSIGTGKATIVDYQ